MPKYPIINTKKPRAIITEKNLKTLETHFNSDPTPSKEVRAQLSNILDLSEESIRVWFQNRRSKARSNGELPAIRRDRGNRFMPSNQLIPSYTPDYSTSNCSKLPESTSSISPTYLPSEFNYLLMGMSTQPQMEMPQSNYCQIPIQSFEFTPLLLDNTMLDDIILQEFLISISAYPFYPLSQY